MMFSQKLKIIMTLAILVLVSLASFSLYNAPLKAVKNYISHDYETSNTIINEELVNQFLSFNKEKNLPEPTVKLNTVNRTMNNSQIIANFKIFTYDKDNNLIDIYSGSLLFSLLRSNWTWEIDSIEIIKDMGN